MRLAALVGVRADQRVELLAQLQQLLVGDHRAAARPAVSSRSASASGFCAAVRDLPGLPLLQQQLHLVGLQQAGDAEVVLLLLAARVRLHAELGAVVQHPVEDGVGLQRLEGQHVLLAGVLVLLAVRPRRAAPPRTRRTGPPRPPSSACRGRGRARPPSRWRSRAASGSVGRNTDAVSPRRRDRTKRPTAWAKNSGVEIVVAYTPTARRGTSTPSDTMRTATIQRSSLVAELVDPLRGAGVVGEHERSAFVAGDLPDQLGVRAGGVLVGGDDQAAGVRDALADLGQPLVGGAQHVGHPLAARVERGAPGLARSRPWSWARRAGRRSRRRPWCASACCRCRRGR